jgi:hypothetical protein
LHLALAGLLVGCSSLKDKFGEITQDKKPSTFSNTAPPLDRPDLGDAPVNTIVFQSCREEIAMDDYKRSLCDINHKLRGTTPPWERATAEARLMSYQPGELHCARTLGGVPDCRVISGVPRPTLLSAPNMGSN